MTRLGVVTGLAAEARCLRRGGAGDAPLFACSGGVASKAAGGARWLIDQGAPENIFLSSAVFMIGMLAFALATAAAVRRRDARR